MMKQTPALSSVEWGAAARAFGGGEACGDRHLVQPFHGGLLAAVVDGLGHGAPAATAAEAAVRTIGLHAGEPLPALVALCNLALKRTRGVVMSLARLEEGRLAMTWLAVGNVAGVLWRADPGSQVRTQHLIPSRGVVGYQIETPREERLLLAPGDTLILATDGVAPGFDQRPLPHMAPQTLAEHIIRRYALPTDDALALVLRWRGAAR